MGYAPLDLLSMSEQPGREFEARKEQFLECGLHELSDMTEEEYVDFFFVKNFFDKKAIPEKFYRLSDLLKANAVPILRQCGITKTDILSGKYDVCTEFRDIQLAPVLLERWSKNKQVYKPDADFAEELLKTEKLQLVDKQLRHLPCNNFYIDLEKCERFTPINGVFVHLHHFPGGVNIVMYLLTGSLYFSFYGGGLYNEKGMIDVNLGDIPEREYDVAPSARTEDTKQIKYKLSRSSVTAFVFQMICYLTSKEPQITDDPVTKNTYRPGRTVKNKFSEVQSHEVGIRYGKSIRKYKQAVNQMKVNEGNESKTDISVAERKPMSPHWRCAHWHHYWTGKGRTEYEVRWIEPVFVGMGDSTESDVVIHRVVN